MNRVIGILAYWVPTYIVIAVVGLLTGDMFDLRLERLEDTFLALHVTTIFISIVLIIVFLLHLRHNIFLSDSQRFWWALGLLFFGAVAIPKYYHDHYGPLSQGVS